ncbi:MAG: hypothetical protein OSA98_07515 [Rubripirellula sp.]|nr:hypothetical protein [Rubripirellula sp.]
MSSDDSRDENAETPVENAAGTLEIAQQVDSDQIAQFVTTIKNAEQQVGENIITALKHDDTVAVLTTVVFGSDGQQRVISAALNQGRLNQVQEILAEAQGDRESEDPCVGFQCLVRPKTTPESDES